MEMRGRGQAAGHQHRRKAPDSQAVRQDRHRQDGGDVGTDAHEAGVAHGKFAHVAVHQIEAHGQDHVDPHVHQDLDDIGVEQAGVGQDPGHG